MLATSIGLIFISGIVLFLLKPERRAWAGWLAAMPPLFVTLWQIVVAFPYLFLEAGTHGRSAMLFSGFVHFENYRWIESLGMWLSFRLDGLSLLFGLIITGVGAAVALYTHSYLEK